MRQNMMKNKKQKTLWKWLFFVQGQENDVETNWKKSELDHSQCFGFELYTCVALKANSGSLHWKKGGGGVETEKLIENKQKKNF